ncbi:winged helix-turn-helix domain-containing protein, partial [Actinophytocola sp.]|uniref:winged helix-turn-helix domain-containing protein n=1 Tax=Actinophytocola sp. TaxID=1872138 RepID=UPI003899C877
VITANLDADTLARVRLATSPAAEATAWLALTAGRGQHPVFGDPGAAARAALADPDTSLVAAVLPPPRTRAYTPDLLTPKPAGGLPDQLDRVAATPAETVADQLASTGRPLPVPVRRAVDDGTFATRAARGLDRFWRAAIADGWSSLRATMDADLATRAHTMATRGVGALFGSLHESLTWAGGTLTVDSAWEERFTLHDVEIVCVPAVLAWPRLAVQLCDPADAVLGYPATGVGARPGTPCAVDRLVGATRAALLRDLGVPRSTSSLAARHRLSSPTVSYHLKVLQRSGLVTAHRDRQFVLYQRTDAGHALAQDA